MDISFKIETFEDNQFQIVDFKATEKQREFITSLRNTQYNILRKSRQIGATTMFAMECVIRIIKNYNYKIIYIPTKSVSGTHFLELVRKIHEQQEGDGITLVDNFNRRKLTFSNGSTIICCTTPDSLCGQDSDWVIFDDSFYNTESVGDMLDIVVSYNKSDITLASPFIKEDKEFKSFYFKSIKGIYKDWHITDYMWYDNPKFNKDIVWRRGVVEIPEQNCTIQTMRLLELGFKRTSPAYEKYLRMFGFDVDIELEGL